MDRRERDVDAPAEALFATFVSLGGRCGWYFMHWAWRLRGSLDTLVGGVGLSRGRRDQHRLVEGDVLDCWRVERVEEPGLLRLRAEMKLPGEGWLEFQAVPRGLGRSTLVQTATFAPRGLGGWVYWYGLLPIHCLIFAGLSTEIARRAEGRRASAAGGVRVSAG